MRATISRPLNRFFNAGRSEQVSLILTLIWLVSALRFNNPQFEQVVLLISLAIDLAARLLPNLMGGLSERKSSVWLAAKFILAIAWLFNPGFTWMSPLIAFLVGCSTLKDFADNAPPDKPDDYDSTIARLGEDVRNRWIEEYFKKTLLNGQENLFIPPVWRFSGKDVETALDLPHLSDQLSTAPILDAFKPAGAGAAGLLILSEGGAGKTVSMLHLMEQLLAQREQQGDGSVPVYFRLASWANDQKTVARIANGRPAQQEQNRETDRHGFHRWLLYRLNKDYHIPVAQCDYLLARGDVILMLDGLDELSTEETSLCVDAINEYLSRQRHPKLVVSCRNEEYRATLRRLRLDIAIILQPLTGEQIIGYVDKTLTNIGTKRDQATTERRNRVRWLKQELTRRLAASRKSDLVPSVARDPDDLLTVLSSPLILSSALRSDAVSIEDLQRNNLASGDGKPLRRRILESYVEDALKRPIKGLPKELQQDYSPPMAKAELSWLAHKLGHGIVFYVDDLQPSWLTEPFWKAIYVLISRFYITVVATFAAGLLLGEPIEATRVALPVAMLITAFHLIMLERNGRRLALDDDAAGNLKQGNPRAARRPSLVSFLLTFFLLFLVMALWFGLTEARLTGDLELSVNGISRASLLALFLSAIFGWKSQVTTWRDEIKTVEGLNFSLRDGIRSMVIWATFIGLVFGGLAAFLGNSLAPNSVPGRWLAHAASQIGLSNSLLVWGGIGFALGFIYGGAFAVIFAGFLTPNDEPRRERPGAPGLPITLSFRNAIVVALETGVAFSLVFGVVLYGLTGNFDAFIRGVFVGLAIGLMAALWYGGTDTIKHYVLRTVFYLKGLPFRYLDRLDWLTKTTLILQQGRGYAFYHEEVKQIFDEQTTERLKERFDIKRLPALLAVTLGLLLFPTVYSLLNGVTYRVAVPPTTFEVPADVPSYLSGRCLSAGDEVEVRSRGIVRVGTFSGYTGPEGSGIGFAGLPVYGIYNVVPSLPNGALMCRVAGESAWQLCAARSSTLIYQLPFTWRNVTLVAPSAGCLEFTVNDMDRQDNSGAFQVVVSKTGG